jgi:hypothetical protein
MENRKIDDTRLARTERGVQSLCEKHFLNGIIIETFGGGQRLFWHELD